MPRLRKPTIGTDEDSRSRFAAGAAIALTIALIGFGAAGGAALIGPPDRAAAAKPPLKRFGSCARVADYARSHAGGQIPYAMTLEDTATGGREAVAQAPAAGGEAEPDDSLTNVQEAGIDEPDIVKSNGSIVFAIARGRLYAVDATAAVPSVLGSLRLPEGPGEHPDAYDEQLLLAGDRALVISRAYADAPPWERTILTEVEVGDPAAMGATRTMRVDGSFVTARLAGETARVVVSAAPGPPVIPVGAGVEEAALQPRPGALRPGWMPAAVVHDRDAGTVDRRRLVRCDDIRRPRRFSGVGLLTVITIDLARGLPAIDSDAVMTGGETVYASPDALYVATERWLGPGVADDRVSQVATLIHKFDTSSPHATEYRASGRVPGFMLSQWSMSERDGLLRVASTTSPPWDGPVPAAESESYVTVLGETGGALREVGQVGGLGRGERIYAVRFFDDVGFVVTFREVDPLYAIDLSDPTDPRKLGELKVPGYSAYLHPVSDDLLLGVGQDADRDGATRGVTVSLFDVSDLGHPTRIDRWAAGRNTHTEVEYDHHSFLHWPPSSLAVLPLEAWGYEGPRFMGAVGLRVATGSDGASPGIAEIARISHGRSWNAALRRAVVVDGRLLAISARAVSTHDPATLSELGRAAFR